MTLWHCICTIAWRLVRVVWIIANENILGLALLLSGFAAFIPELHLAVFSVRTAVELIFFYHETSLTAILA